MTTTFKTATGIVLRVLPVQLRTHFIQTEHNHCYLRLIKSHPDKRGLASAITPPTVGNASIPDRQIDVAITVGQTQSNAKTAIA